MSLKVEAKVQEQTRRMDFDELLSFLPQVAPKKGSGNAAVNPRERFQELISYAREHAPER